MKTRGLALVVLFGFVFALAWLALASQSAVAQDCFDVQGAPKPCPDTGKDPNQEKKVRPTVTDVPSPTPTPVVDTPTPVAVVVCATPGAAELALMCANVLPAVGGGAGVSEDTLPTPSRPPISPFLIPAGALLGGVLLGLVLPSIFEGLRRLRRLGTANWGGSGEYKGGHVKIGAGEYKLGDDTLEPVKLRSGEYKLETGEYTGGHVKIGTGEYKLETGEYEGGHVKTFEKIFPKVEDAFHQEADAFDQSFPKVEDSFHKGGLGDELPGGETGKLK